MNIKHLVIAAVASLGLISSAIAVPLTFIPDPQTIPASYDDYAPYYLGRINDGTPPGGGTPSNEFTWLEELIAMAPGTADQPSTNPAGEWLTRSWNVFGVLPTPVDELKSDPALTSYTLLSTSLYILGKYGNDGVTGQMTHVWYVGGLAAGTDVTLPDAGLSHSTIFSGTRVPEGPSVPDGGVSILLLGAALTALGFSRRFVRR